MPTAIYPGTFDPVHNGHIDIATRAARLFEHLTIAIYARPLKNLLFTTEERRAMLEEALDAIPNIQIVTYRQLTVDFARQIGAQAIVRGLRVISDFELEFQMALTNKKLAPEIEFVCLMTSQEYAFLSSSTVKEIAMLGGCVEGMVPPHVAQAMREKFQKPDGQGGSQVRLVSLRD
ncbi:MAG TPA: pantetheine-phosphate adenylyltransferase [Anaerolineae bacterium]|nr:pantetheine-phosphate adenylyltransferase [Anaerolineae bacterium]